MVALRQTVWPGLDVRVLTLAALCFLQFVAASSAAPPAGQGRRQPQRPTTPQVQFGAGSAVAPNPLRIEPLVPVPTAQPRRPPAPGMPAGPLVNPSLPELTQGGNIIHVEPPRWNWVHWWEANRGPYLVPSRPDAAEQKPDQQAMDAYQAKAFEVCRKAAQSPDPAVRAAAAVALGRMGESVAHSILADLALKDPDEPVRVAAIVAMGLLGTADADLFLYRLRFPEEQEPLWNGVCVATGLVSEPSSNSVASLQKVAGGKLPGPAIAAAWGLRQHMDAAAKPFMHNVITKSNSPWLVSEAILAQGKLGDRDAVALLADIVKGTVRAQALPVWKMLEWWHEDTLVAAKSRLTANQIQQLTFADVRVTNLGNRQRMEITQNWPFGLDPNVSSYRSTVELPRGDGSGPGNVDPRSLGLFSPFNSYVGLPLTYLAQLRASAAIALGNIDDPAAERALADAILAADDSPFTDLYRQFAIISLGKMGATRAPELLGGILSPLAKPRQRKSDFYFKSPLRGFAAIGLGLYVRAADDEVRPRGGRSRRAEVCRMLAQRLADRGELDEVRAAAALGLGLTGQTENLQPLQKAFKTARISPLVAGYAFLARGILGDQTIIEPAGKLLRDGKGKDDMPGLLARRAAAMGLGMLGKPEVIPVLVDALKQNEHVGREAACALGRCGAQNATEKLVELFDQAVRESDRAFAVTALGELFAKGDPEPLARLTNGSNYTVKNMQMYAIQRLANEFLYAYMIVQFGDNWW